MRAFEMEPYRPAPHPSSPCHVGGSGSVLNAMDIDLKRTDAEAVSISQPFAPAPRHSVRGDWTASRNLSFRSQKKEGLKPILLVTGEGSGALSFPST